VILSRTGTGTLADPILITADYHFDGSRHDFTARVDIVEIIPTATISGVVTDGWLQGNLAVGEFTVTTCATAVSQPPASKAPRHPAAQVQRPTPQHRTRVRGAARGPSLNKSRVILDGCPLFGVPKMEQRQRRPKLGKRGLMAATSKADRCSETSWSGRREATSPPSRR
jgi:hypothetical protein